MEAALVTWLGAFCFTQAVEVPVYLLAQRSTGPGWRSWRTGWRSWRTRWPVAMLVALAASLWTHPLVWFLFPVFPRAWGCTASIRCWQQYAVMAESFAVLAEAAWLWRRGVSQPLAWSLLANGLSFGLGALLFW